MRPLPFLRLPFLAAGLVAGGTALLAQTAALPPPPATAAAPAAAAPADPAASTAQPAPAVGTAEPAPAGTDMAPPPPTSGAVLQKDLSGPATQGAPGDPAPVTRDDQPQHAKDNSIDSASSAAPAEPSPVPGQPAPEGALNALPTFTPAGQQGARAIEPGDTASAAEPSPGVAPARAPVAAADPAAPAPTSIRGAAPDQAVTLPEVYHDRQGRAVRAYRQQPPIIPHTIDKYQIDLNANQCLACHDWTNAGERGAPTLSMTHYLDRNGQQLDSVAGTRWFCNQCHVPQADAPPLVANTFQPSAQR